MECDSDDDFFERMQEAADQQREEEHTETEILVDNVMPIIYTDDESYYEKIIEMCSGSRLVVEEDNVAWQVLLRDIIKDFQPEGTSILSLLTCDSHAESSEIMLLQQFLFSNLPRSAKILSTLLDPSLWHKAWVDDLRHTSVTLVQTRNPSDWLLFVSKVEMFTEAVANECTKIMMLSLEATELDTLRLGAADIALLPMLAAALERTELAIRRTERRALYVLEQPNIPLVAPSPNGYELCILRSLAQREAILQRIDVKNYLPSGEFLHPGSCVIAMGLDRVEPEIEIMEGATKDNTPSSSYHDHVLGWCLTCPDGEIGPLFVDADFQDRGVEHIILVATVADWLTNGRKSHNWQFAPFTYICDDVLTDMEIALFSNLGFVKVDDHYWMEYSRKSILVPI